METKRDRDRERLLRLTILALTQFPGPDLQLLRLLVGERICQRVFYTAVGVEGGG